MYPLHCPKCGRWLKDSWSYGFGDAIHDYDECHGICKVHGYQVWTESY